MTAPAWATDLTDIILEPVSTTNWAALGGGPAGLALETDFYIQGSVCLSKGAWVNAAKGFLYDSGGPWAIPTDGVLLGWALYGPATASLDTQANGGLRMVIGSSATAYHSYYFGGKDTLTFETWIPVGIDPDTATPDATVGIPGTWTAFGVVAYLPTAAGPIKGNPLGMDALRYGRHILEYTYGDGSPDYNTFALAEATANSGANRWGNIEYIKGAYFAQGFHSFGVSGTPVDFQDSNVIVFIRACEHNLANDAVTAAYNRFEIINAGSNVDWDNIIFQSLGTRSPGTFVHTAGTFDTTNCQFIDVGTFSLLSTSVMTDCIFRGTGAITAPGSNLTGSQVLSPAVAIDASALVWDVATDPDGKLDGMTFSKSSLAHHAIELGLTSPTSVTLRNVTMSGFSASNGNNDSTIHVKRTSGTVTINVIGGTGNFSYKTAGAAVVVVSNPVKIELTVKDIVTSSEIANARVLVTVADGINFPYRDIVTIARSGTTATVSHTGHGFETGDEVLIEDAEQWEYNGARTIAYIDAGSYSYQVVGTPTTPATGTIRSTMVIIDEDTSTGGIADDTRTYNNDQPFVGTVRQGTSEPYYKPQPLQGTIDKDSGYSTIVQLIPDS